MWGVGLVYGAFVWCVSSGLCGACVAKVRRLKHVHSVLSAVWHVARVTRVACTVYMASDWVGVMYGVFVARVAYVLFVVRLHIV